MKKHLLILTLFVWSFAYWGYAQVTFQKAIGTNIGFDDGHSVKQTKDGGFIISGYAWTNSFSPSILSAYLVKTDWLGNLTWSKTFSFGGSTLTYGLDADQSDDGGYILIGWSGAGATGYFFLAKTNNAGDSLWTKYYWPNYNSGLGNASVNCVRQTPDHGYIVGGTSSISSDSIDDGYLMKTDSMGNVLWSKSYSGAHYNGVNTMTLTTDKGFIVAGNTNSFNAGSSDIYIVRIDSVGNTLWTRRYG